MFIMKDQLCVEGYKIISIFSINYFQPAEYIDELKRGVIMGW